MELSKAIVLMLVVLTFGCFVDSKPIQVLKEKPGYIGVYIRHGNEPLENINPALAEAFGETSNDVNAVIPPADTTTELIDAPAVMANKKKRSAPESAFLGE